MAGSEEASRLRCTDEPFLTEVERQERALLEASGGLTPIVRMFAGRIDDFLLFMASYNLFWPRHLAKGNLTVVLDMDSRDDAVAGMLIQALSPCVRVVYTDEMRYAPPSTSAQELFPGASAQVLANSTGRRRSCNTGHRDESKRGGCDKARAKGYDRQQWHTFWVDQEVASGLIAYLDADIVLQGPLTLESLFDAVEPSAPLRPLVRLRHRKRFLPGCKVMLSPAMCRALPFDAMAYFPVVLHRSTLVSLRSSVAARSHRSFATVFAAAAATGSYSQFDIIATWAFTHERGRYTFQVMEPFRRVKNPDGMTCADVPPLSMSDQPAPQTTQRSPHPLPSVYMHMCIQMFTCMRHPLPSAFMHMCIQMFTCMCTCTCVSLCVCIRHSVVHT